VSAARHRSLALIGLLFALAGLQACGQTGPLQLPQANTPVTADDSEDREDDER
jgi:predicted small lipoprotein YifL